MWREDTSQSVVDSYIYYHDKNVYFNVLINPSSSKLFTNAVFINTDIRHQPDMPNYQIWTFSGLIDNIDGKLWFGVVRVQNNMLYCKGSGYQIESSYLGFVCEFYSSTTSNKVRMEKLPNNTYKKTDEWLHIEEIIKDKRNLQTIMNDINIQKQKKSEVLGL